MKTTEPTITEYDGPDNIYVEVAFGDFESPFEVYRNAYKYTECGPSIGFLIRDTTEKEQDRWYYGDELRQLGSWRTLEKRGWLITHISMHSIVEGINDSTNIRLINVSEPGLECCAIPEDMDELPATLRRVFYECLDEVDQEAAALWIGTHGCDVCADHFGISNDELSPVWTDCPNCLGEGVTF